MPSRFLEELFTPEVRAAQEQYTRRAWPRFSGEERDRMGPDEAEFVSERDSFYLATVSSSGWPYVQHRGGPAGFVEVVDDRTLAFPDYRGNKQMITTGNVASDDRVALILLDYPARTRLKVLGRARVDDVRRDAELTGRFGAQLAGKVERIVRVDVVAFDWNCPSFITQRYTVAEVEGLVSPLRRKIAALEAKLAKYT